MLFFLIVDGQWCNWSPFSDCSVTCGGGEMTRTRYCNSPVPENGGADCEGSDTDTASCGEDNCPGEFVVKAVRLII